MPSRIPAPAVAAVLSACALAAPPAALAAWPDDPYVGNVPLTLAAGSQHSVEVASDGAGGAIVVWEDDRGADTDIYVQRIDATGATLWTTDGVAVCTASGAQTEPRIAPDGAGGAVITWRDARNAPGDAANIYAQRVNAAGVPQWTVNGVAVCNAADLQFWPEIVADGTGGAIIVWGDRRNGTTYDVYIQRLNSLGAPRWTVNGVLLRTAAGDAQLPRLLEDGAGGAIAVWADYRAVNTALYAQRVNSTGVPQWTVNGVDIGASGYVAGHVVTTDGAGGMIVAWTSFLSTTWDVRAQRVTASGGLLWFYGGVEVSGGTLDQHAARLVPDGSGGAIVAFEDSRTGLWQIAAQRMSAGGGRLWGNEGVALTSHTNGVGQPRAATDGAGGVIVTWNDGRANAQGSLFGQRVTGSGSPLWTADGVPICAAAGGRVNHAMVDDGSGGVILAWQDSRNGTQYDVYAQRVERHGRLGEPAPAIAAVNDLPNDQGGFVRVSWDASSLDEEPDYGITEYRLYRSVPVSGASARRPVTADSDVAVAEGALLAVGSGGGTTYWEFVAAQEAQAFEGYSLVAATPADSVEGSNPRTLFLVEARGGASSSSPHWYSAPDSGYSVDNLAPDPPVQFAGTYTSGTSRLSWQPSAEADFAEYRLHRGTSPSFEPDATNLVSAQPDTGYVDAAGMAYHYKLTAVDVHGNVSGHVGWAPLEVVGVPGGLDAGIAFAPPAPNPAARSTALHFALPRAAHVRLTVLDVAGREVRVLADGSFAAGPHTLAWDLRAGGGNAAAAGVYFARLEADGRTLVRRVAVTR